MSCITWLWNSESLLSILRIGIEVVGCLAQLIIAIVAIIELPEEWTSRRKKRLKRQIEVFSLIAATMVFFVVLLNYRTNGLQEKRIAALALQKQPIASVSASVHFRIRGSKKMNPERKLGEWVAILQFYDEEGLSKPALFSLIAEKYNMWGREDVSNVDSDYHLVFQTCPLVEATRFSGYGKPAEIVDSIRGFILDVFMLPSDAEILNGSVTITLNSSIQKTFPIVPQKLKDDFRINTFWTSDVRATSPLE